MDAVKNLIALGFNRFWAEKAAGGGGIGYGCEPTLPAWTYSRRNRGLHDLERRKIFLCNWQIVGHVAEVQRQCDFTCFNYNQAQSDLKSHSVPAG